MNPNPSDLDREARGARARAALEATEPFLREEEAAIDRELVAAIDAGDMTPERALAFCYRRHAVGAWRRRLLAATRSGAAASERVGRAPLPEG